MNGYTNEETYLAAIVVDNNQPTYYAGLRVANDPTGTPEEYADAVRAVWPAGESIDPDDPAIDWADLLDTARQD